MNEQIVLKPQQVTAMYQDGALTIHAAGHEDGVRDIRIEALATEIIPPEFAVVGRPSPAIGLFPYSVDGRFPEDRNPEEIVVSGERVKVTG